MGAVPLAVLMGVESMRGRTGTRQWVWNKLGGALKDVAGVAAVAAPGAYGRVRWSWEPELFDGKNVVGLTIDDAPGDNPELFEQVCGAWGVGYGVWGVGCGVWVMMCGSWYHSCMYLPAPRRQYVGWDASTPFLTRARAHPPTA